MQFFEVATYAVCCGVVCLAVFRGLAHKTFGAVWVFNQSLLAVDWRHIVYGKECFNCSQAASRCSKPVPQPACGGAGQLDAL